MPRYIEVHETASTNSYLLRLASTLPGGTVIYTPRQTAGRGQKGNSWESEPGKNIACSMLLKLPPVKAREQFAISEATALAVRDALAAQGGEGFAVKWPNDVYWHDRKIAGILIENSLQGTDIATSVVGIGINVNQEQFVSDAPNPVSLKQITGRDHDLDALMHAVCEQLERQVSALADSSERTSLHDRYRAALYRNDGAEHAFETADGERLMAVIDDVLPMGELQLRHADGSLHAYLFKQVKHVINDQLTI